MVEHKWYYETWDCNNDEGGGKGEEDNNEVCWKKSEVDHHDEEDETINDDGSCFGSDIGFNNDSVLNVTDYGALSFANDVSPKAKSVLFEMVELQQRQQHLQQQLLEELIKNQRFQYSYAAQLQMPL